MFVAGVVPKFVVVSFASITVLGVIRAPRAHKSPGRWLARRANKKKERCGINTHTHTT